MQAILMVGFVVLLAIFFALLVLRDRENSTKFKHYEGAIESLMRENYELKKRIETLAKETNNIDIDRVQIELEEFLDSRLRDKTLPMLATLQELKQKISEQQSEQQNRINSLEERTRDFSKLTPPTPQSESELILAQYRSGKSVEMIAKDMQLGVGRVEFVLKMSGISLS